MRTAEDITQEALWAAYQRRHRLIDSAKEQAWLLAFVRNKGRDALIDAIRTLHSEEKRTP